MKIFFAIIFGGVGITILNNEVHPYSLAFGLACSIICLILLILHFKLRTDW